MGLLLLLAAAAPAMARVPAGEYRPFMIAPRAGADAGTERPATVPVRAFRLDVRPVTQGEYLAFVQKNAAWRRSKIPRVFADPSYLKSWSGDLAPPPQRASAPVVEVSWFAARAYCKARGARLATTAEWERAAAEEGEAARATAQRILDWYATPRSSNPRASGSGPANALGLRDLHGLVWEWVLDFNEALVAGDTRDDKGGEGSLFCGGGAARAADPSDYATFMRYAFRSSLSASFTTRDLGFRCARDE